MNLDDVREILALMRENGISEFEIEREGLKLRLRKDSVATTVTSLPVVVAGMHAAAHRVGDAGIRIRRSGAAGRGTRPKLNSQS